MKKDDTYICPECETVSAIWTFPMICASPESGGLEDIDYEDLVL